MNRTRLERRSGDSIEYWQIELLGPSHLISRGLVGQEVSTVQQDFDCVSACVAGIQRRIATQLRLGFKNVSPKPSPLWRALKANEKSFDLVGGIEAGADPNEGYEGVSLLQLALANNRDKVTFALFEKGAKACELPPNSLNLVWAVGTGRVNLLRAFVDAGADVGMQTALGTPLSYAVKEGEPDMVAILIEAGADINTGGMSSPLFEALNKGHEEIAICLIDAGASLAPLTSQYYLDYAIIRSFPNVVERLAAAGCKLESRSSYDKGKRPQDMARFIAACRNISMEKAYSLFETTPDLVRKKMDHVTPLLIAVYQDEPGCAEILLRYGSNADVQDGSGMSASDLATRMQRKKILLQLKDALTNPRAKESPTHNNAPKPRDVRTIIKRRCKEILLQLQDALATSPAKEFSTHNKAPKPRTPRDVRTIIEEHLSARTSTDAEVVATLASSMSIEALRKRYDYEAVTERLCDSCSDKTFQDAVGIVGEVCDSRRRDRSGEFGGYDFQLSQSLSLDSLQVLQQTLLPLGAFVYCFSRGSQWGIPGTLRVIPTCDRYDCLVVQGTSAGNHDMGTADIIAWLRTREPINPFSILWAEHDTIKGSFLDAVENADELAASMYDFCDDIVDQGTGSVEALANELRKSQSLYFWWD